MSSPGYYTWSFNLPTQPARAASLDDLGGAALQDDAAYPPIPPEMPYANQLNQWALQLGGLQRTTLALDLEIQFVTGVPTIVNATGMSDQLTTSYCIANLTVTHVSTGVVTIGWLAGTLPFPRAKPRAWHTDATPAPQPVAVPGVNEVGVQTWNLAGTPTDLPFVVSIF